MATLNSLLLTIDSFVFHLLVLSVSENLKTFCFPSVAWDGTPEPLNPPITIRGRKTEAIGIM